MSVFINHPNLETLKKYKNTFNHKMAVAFKQENKNSS